jgi:hypothetical protein
MTPVMSAEEFNKDFLAVHALPLAQISEYRLSEEFSVTNFFLHKSNFGMFKAACLFKSTKYLAGQALLYHESKYSYTAVSVMTFSTNLICQYLALYDPEQDIYQYF